MAGAFFIFLCLPMIVFDLICGLGHAFEGWFQSPEIFEAQRAQEMIACPHCGSTEISRVPSAVRFSRKDEERRAGRASGSGPVNAPKAPPSGQTRLAPEAMQSLFGRMVSSIIANTEDVGRAFADEARRIHYLEAPERPIRGEASLKEYESLRDEGIEVMLLPLIKKEKTH